MFRILAFLLGRRVVMLKGSRGVIYRTWELKGLNFRYAPVYPMFSLGFVELLPGGHVRQPHFIKEWWYADDKREVLK